MALYIFFTFVAILAAITGLVVLMFAYCKCKPNPSFTFCAIICLAFNVLCLLNQAWVLCVAPAGEWYLKFYSILGGIMSIAFAMVICKFPGKPNDYFYFTKQFLSLLKLYKMVQVAYFYDDLTHEVSSIDGNAVSPAVKVEDLPAHDSDFKVFDAASQPLVNEWDEPYIEREISALAGHSLVIDNVTVQPQPFVGGRPPRKPR